MLGNSITITENISGVGWDANKEDNTTDDDDDDTVVFLLLYTFVHVLVAFHGLLLLTLTFRSSFSLFSWLSLLFARCMATAYTDKKCANASHNDSVLE